MSRSSRSRQSQKSNNASLPTDSAPTHQEWVVGQQRSSMIIDEDEPFHPTINLVLELPDYVVLGSEVTNPEEGVGALLSTLARAMREPVVGEARQPRRIRVDDEDIARQISAAYPTIQVVTAPTPEFDMVIGDLMNALAEANGVSADQSYLDDGDIDENCIAAFFKTSAALYRAAPWTVIDADRLIGIDIPQFNINKAAIAVIGALNEELGLILFPDVDVVAKIRSVDGQAQPDTRDMSFTALNFQRGADISPRMRREVADHGWQVVDQYSYPTTFVHTERGVLKWPAQRDYKVMSACAAAVTRLVQDGLPDPAWADSKPISFSCRDDVGTEVHLTYPYEEDVFGAPDDALPTPMPRTHHKIGRNDPCWCGSGKKYKKCCINKPRPEATLQTKLAIPGIEADFDIPEDPVDAIIDMDERLVFEISDFAERRFGAAWTGCLDGLADVFDDSDVLTGRIPVQWSLFHKDLDGRTAADWFADHRGLGLARTERDWLDCQQDAWLSVWEVSGVEPDEYVIVSDRLSGALRLLRHNALSQFLQIYDNVLARIVEYDNESLLIGRDPIPLSPIDAEYVVARMRRFLRLKRDVPAERLRAEKSTRFLIERWQEAAMQRHKIKRIDGLTNGDGEPMCFTTDIFDFAAKDVNFIKQCFDVDVQHTDVMEGTPIAYVVVGGEEQQRVVGQIAINETTLETSTNSIARADHVRGKVEQSCQGRVQHRDRLFGDRHESTRDRVADERSAPLPLDHTGQVVREAKMRHYMRWIDESIPALGHKTPRQAVMNEAGRAQVEQLIGDITATELQSAPHERFDVWIIRRALGLDIEKH